MTKKCIIRKGFGFSLVEVVLAIGVIAFAIVAILGVLPIGLATSHSGQDETRAAQMAQDILSSLASQASLNYDNATIAQPPNFSYGVPLNRDYTYQPLGADNDGRLQANYSAGLPYKITLSTNANPTGFDSGYACQVTIRVAWQPFAQNYRDYVQIISKY